MGIYCLGRNVIVTAKWYSWVKFSGTKLTMDAHFKQDNNPSLSI